MTRRDWHLVQGIVRAPDTFPRCERCPCRWHGLKCGRCDCETSWTDEEKSA